MIRISAPTIGDEEIRAATAVLRSGRLVQGQEVAEFERAWEEKFGYPAVAVSSGTAALTLLLRAHGVKEGDEVILPSFTFFATAEAVVACGATPVFADIERSSFCIDPARVESAIGSRTVAVIAVHLFGQPARLSQLLMVAERHHLLLLEDACQAHGATLGIRNVGAFGDGGVFSFYPSKNMTTMEGGMVVTRDRAIVRKLRLLRNHGLSEANYEHELCAGNFKMTELQAAIGRVQLLKLDNLNARRRETAAYYSSRIADMPNVTAPKVGRDVRHVFNQFTVRVDPERRDLLQKALAEHGVESRIYYPKGIHEQPMFLNMADPGELPETVRATKEVLSLPVHTGVTNDERERVINALGALT